MNALRQRGKKKLPRLWDLLTWKLNRAAGAEISGPQEPMVTLKVGGQNMDLMVDTGAELSVVTKPVAPLSKKTTAVTGVSGEEMIKSFLPAQKMPDGGGTKGFMNSSTFLSAQYPCWEETCSPN